MELVVVSRQENAVLLGQQQLQAFPRLGANGYSIAEVVDGVNACGANGGQYRSQGREVSVSVGEDRDSGAHLWHLA